MESLSPAGAWTCPTCGNPYPADFAVCPRDATPRADPTVAGVDPMIGVVLGHAYRIVKVIGQGGMARLYEAEHLRVDRRYAVKVIHDDLARSPDLLARFEREARVAARIRSKHVLSVIDVLRTSDGRPCIVTDLLEGEDLQAHLSRGKMAPARAIPVARQICRALTAAHAVGVVHRDLKPSNIFLSKGGGEYMVKVLDFGVAKLAEDDALTRTDAIVGTPAYMAPEQARRAASAGPPADVYSVGAVLYHMFTGEPPYGKAPASSRLALLLHEEPPRPREVDPSVPEGIEAVIQHAMARDPASRPPSAAALESELAAFDRSLGSVVAPLPDQMPGPAGGPPAAMTTEVDDEPPQEVLATAITTHTAEGIALRARLARPAAAAVAALSSAAAGAWVAVLLAEIVGTPGALTGSERTLIGLLGAAAAAALLVVHVRILRACWRSAPAVDRHARTVGRTLIAGVAVFGLVELAMVGSISVLGWAPGGWFLQILVSGVAAVIGLRWPQVAASPWVRRLVRRPDG